jgi:AraC family transcriptional activator of pyochelin receptor
MASSVEMGRIEVSPEMLTLLGSGSVGGRCWPEKSVAFEFTGKATDFIFHARPTAIVLNRKGNEQRMIFLVARSACERLLGGKLELEDRDCYLLPAELRAIATAIRDCAMSDAAAEPYRLAKSIELLCEILAAHGRDELLSADSPTLSFADCQRVASARQLIEENWRERLTLSQIARTCGLNRSKLSRGFRELYRCSVSEALTERRLGEARRELLATDLPVGLIGYRSGYQNNASFSRAFCRRFGVPPSDFRARGMAA